MRPLLFRRRVEKGGVFAQQRDRFDAQRVDALGHAQQGKGVLAVVQRLEQQLFVAGGDGMLRRFAVEEGFQIQRRAEEKDLKETMALRALKRMEKPLFGQ